MLRTTKPQAFTCLRNDLSSWLFSCSEMGGVCLLYMGCCCFFPSSLLEMFRAGGDLECRGERLSPHPHWFRKSHLYCGQPHKDVVGVGVQVFVFFSLPFPIYLLWPEAPANNSIHGSQYCILQTWPHTAPGLLLAKTGKFFAAREIDSLKEACLEDLHFLFLPSPTLLIVDLKTPGIC